MESLRNNQVFVPLPSNGPALQVPRVVATDQIEPLLPDYVPLPPKTRGPRFQAAQSVTLGPLNVVAPLTDVS